MIQRWSVKWVSRRVYAHACATRPYTKIIWMTKNPGSKQFKGRDIADIFACFAREDLEHKLMLEEYDSVILAEN